ncbi:hypothetical protein GUITHDRAFT_119526 [Guillardia theta CCMP2712]|uniref:Uncharacterized protein n=4 Tax=Guillardia theta TaxID=55529 RepID=L1IDK4_GUITC|nr:hypothetical protein GUITHDRAFT_119526 [Guillardia theta CCMP2712]EKX34293.1 hypothetical protein GUITHDRAFT_119526 [Guillardia theta CCMP2712]|eukprot:XP_005821273.1 hypothetical protein GUITHDRAFT_119526 [Guillardia theta CCMP2712]
MLESLHPESDWSLKNPALLEESFASASCDSMRRRRMADKAALVYQLVENMLVKENAEILVCKGLEEEAETKHRQVEEKVSEVNLFLEHVQRRTEGEIRKLRQETETILSSMQSEIKDLTRMNETLQNEIRTQKHQLGVMRNEMRDKESQICILSKSCVDFKFDMMDTSELIDQLEVQFGYMPELPQTAHDVLNVKGQKEQLEALLRERDAMQSNTNERLNDLQELASAEIHDLRRKLSLAENQKMDLMAAWEMEKMENQTALGETSTWIDNLMEEVKRMHRSLSDLQHLHLEAQHKLDQIENCQHERQRSKQAEEEACKLLQQACKITTLRDDAAYLLGALSTTQIHECVQLNLLHVIEGSVDRLSCTCERMLERQVLFLAQLESERVNNDREIREGLSRMKLELKHLSDGLASFCNEALHDQDLRVENCKFHQLSSSILIDITELRAESRVCLQESEEMVQSYNKRCKQKAFLSHKYHIMIERNEDLQDKYDALLDQLQQISEQSSVLAAVRSVGEEARLHRRAAGALASAGPGQEGDGEEERRVRELTDREYQVSQVLDALERSVNRLSMFNLDLVAITNEVLTGRATRAAAGHATTRPEGDESCEHEAERPWRMVAVVMMKSRERTSKMKTFSFLQINRSINKTYKHLVRLHQDRISWASRYSVLHNLQENAESKRWKLLTADVDHLHQTMETLLHALSTVSLHHNSSNVPSSSSLPKKSFGSSIGQISAAGSASRKVAHSPFDNFLSPSPLDVPRYPSKELEVLLGQVCKLEEEKRILDNCAGKAAEEIQRLVAENDDLHSTLTLLQQHHNALREDVDMSRLEAAKAKVGEEHLRQELEAALAHHAAEKRSMAAQIVRMREKVEKESTGEVRQVREELNKQIDHNRELLDELESAIVSNHKLQQANHTLDHILSRLRDELTSLKSAMVHAVDDHAGKNSLEALLGTIDRFLDEAQALLVE